MARADKDYDSDFVEARRITTTESCLMRFRVTGIDPRRPKCPISATRFPDGKGYKFTAENVALVLRAAMKDVSPNR